MAPVKTISRRKFRRPILGRAPYPCFPALAWVKAMEPIPRFSLIAQPRVPFAVNRNLYLGLCPFFLDFRFGSGKG